MKTQESGAYAVSVTVTAGAVMIEVGAWLTIVVVVKVEVVDVAVRVFVEMPKNEEQNGVAEEYWLRAVTTISTTLHSKPLMMPPRSLRSTGEAWELANRAARVNKRSIVKGATVEMHLLGEKDADDLKSREFSRE